MRALFRAAFFLAVFQAAGSMAEEQTQQTDEQKTDLPPLPPSPGTEALPLPANFQEVEKDVPPPVKPSLNILDLHGYLRLRADLMDSLDLGLGKHSTSYSAPEDRGVSYPQFPTSATGKHGTLAMANMRFRLEPTVNISEDVHIMAQFDILDNLILGSTPDAFPGNKYFPLAVFSQGQIPPTAGYNSLRDSIAVKRIWGEVMTPLGLLRFGRMPSHWGLGLLANDGGPMHYENGPLVTQLNPMGGEGACFDCDYGSTADRILFATKIFGHYVVPMLDFTSEGPYFSQENEYNGQPVDFDQLDDVNSWILAVFKRDKHEDIRAALNRGEWVLNYGLYFVFRNQAWDASEYNVAGDAGAGRNQRVEKYTVRNAYVYIPDIWVRLMWQRLRLELELCFIAGKIGYTNIGHNVNVDGDLMKNIAEGSITIFQAGAVLQADYKLLDEQMTLGMEIGFASGDDSPGMGVRPFEESQFSYAHGDKNINNFRFNPDYHVDMILWRQIIGTVTDSFYFKPSIRYDFAEGFGGKLSAIYSSAVYPASTRGKARPLGLEFNLDFFYFSSDNFHAGFAYGILIPFDGMDYLGEDMARGGIGESNKDDGANVAHRLLARMVLYF